MIRSMAVGRHHYNHRYNHIKHKDTNIVLLYSIVNTWCSRICPVSQPHDLLQCTVFEDQSTSRMNDTCDKVDDLLNFHTEHG